MESSDQRISFLLKKLSSPQASAQRMLSGMLNLLTSSFPVQCSTPLFSSITNEHSMHKESSQQVLFPIQRVEKHNPFRVDQITSPLHNKHFCLSMSYIPHRLSTTSSSLGDQEGSNLGHTADVIKMSCSVMVRVPLQTKSPVLQMIFRRSIGKFGMRPRSWRF